MLEILIASLFVTVAVAALSRSTYRITSLTRGQSPIPRFDGDSPSDLPCPWCYAPTREEDRACPSCGQRFG